MNFNKACETVAAMIKATPQLASINGGVSVYKPHYDAISETLEQTPSRTRNGFKLVEGKLYHGSIEIKRMGG